MFNDDLYNNKIFFFLVGETLCIGPTRGDTRVADNDGVNENCSKPFHGYRWIAQDDNDAPSLLQANYVIEPSQNLVQFILNIYM